MGGSVSFATDKYLIFLAGKRGQYLPVGSPEALPGDWFCTQREFGKQSLTCSLAHYSDGQEASPWRGWTLNVSVGVGGERRFPGERRKRDCLGGSRHAGA